MDKPRVKLTLRGSGEPVELVGSNSGLPSQVQRNKKVRAILGERAANLLLIEVRVKDTVMLLDSRALVPNFYAPETDAEKRAVEEMEAAVQTAVRIGVMQEKAQPVLDYANELLWLLFTGNVRNVETWDRAGLPGSSKEPGSWVLQETMEPVYGAMPYEEM